MSYKIVKADTLAKLERAVDKETNYGWEATGGPMHVVTNQTFHQAMTKRRSAITMATPEEVRPVDVFAPEEVHTMRCQHSINDILAFSISNNETEVLLELNGHAFYMGKRQAKYFAKVLTQMGEYL